MEMFKKAKNGNTMTKAVNILPVLLLFLLFLSSCVKTPDNVDTDHAEESLEYTYEVYDLKRNGYKLHLDSMKMTGTQPEKNILLIHGVTYSSHEFDVDYEDYSLVRALAREGYMVWRLDITGFGQSDAVTDGFLPDSDYAAEDINATVDKILEVTGEEVIDLLGWSWGTVTVSRYAVKHPDHINKLVLYAPIISGIGEYELKEPFHKNTWEHAAEDFQRDDSGGYDLEIADPVVINILCSNSWRYDGENSPNGGRRDLCVSDSVKLIDFSALKMPTLVIYGDRDPYINFECIDDEAEFLPEGSSVEVIPGASHVAFIEKPYHRDFQERVFRFLSD